MADHSKPTTTSLYANFVTELDARLDDLAVGLDPAVTTVTNPPTGAIRWNSATARFQKWNGSTWGDLSALYQVNISGNAATATTLQTTRTINTVNFNGSANIVVEPYVEQDLATAATRYITFVDSSVAGYQRLNLDDSLSYNPSTNTLTVANLAGTASTAANVAAGAAGQVLFQSGAGVTGKTAAGSTGQVLTSAGTGTPTWTSQSALAAGTATTATNLAGGLQGSIPYQTAAGATTLLAKGTAGQVLTMNAGATAPSWAAVAVPDSSVTPAKLTQPLTLGTAQATTSGTAKDFTGIPAWAKRVTVMFTGVSTNGTSPPQLQIGSGSVLTSGYLSSNAVAVHAASTGCANFTTGFGIGQSIGNWAAGAVFGGAITLTHMGGNVWVASGSVGRSDSPAVYFTAGSVGLAGALDRLRLTTVNGTDAFDAGSMNIMYE